MATACPAGASHDLESEQMMKRFTMKGIYRSGIGLLGLNGMPGPDIMLAPFLISTLVLTLAQTAPLPSGYSQIQETGAAPDL
jgi:hypothetical protein